MKTKLLKIGLLLICITGLFGFTQIKAQNLSGRIWIFPDSCGVDFRDTNNVTAFYGTNLSSRSSGAAISTDNGNLIFYSDGVRVKDERNQYISNFDSMSLISAPTKTFFFQNSTDSNLINMFTMKGPSSDYVHKYYLKRDNPISAFLDSSGTEVININPFTSNYNANHGIRSWMLDAVRHGNGRDWWIIANLGSAYVFADSFAFFLLTDDTLLLHHYIDTGKPVRIGGELDISEDGSKLCLSSIDSNKVFEWDLDRCDGTLSNFNEVYKANFYSWVSPSNFSAHLYGLSYSRSKNYIYGCTADTVYQFNPRATVDSLKCMVIWYDTNHVYALADTTQMRSLELAEDGNIYIGYQRLSLNTFFGYQPMASYLGVIKNADYAYPTCYVNPHGVFLGTQCQCAVQGTLPSVPNYNLGPLIGSPCDTLTTTSTGQWLSPGAQVKVFPNPASDKLNISWPVQGGYMWALKSLAGSTLSSGSQQSGNATISTATLPVGMYFLEVHSAKESKVEKVIVLR